MSFRSATPDGSKPQTGLRKVENNCWYFGPTGEIVVVFVHGFLSDSSRCWTAQVSKSKVFWPDLLSEDNGLKRLDVYLGGYYSSTNSGSFSINQCAEELIAALRSRDAAGSRPVLESEGIVFVAHSLGGIVVRKLILDSEAVFSNKKVGVVLLASPALGSHIADYAKSLSKVLGNRIATELTTQSGVLEDIDDRFRQLVNERASRMPFLTGAEAFENLGLAPKLLTRFSQFFPKIVTKDGIGKYFGAPREIGGTDHISIAKPTSVRHRSHRFLSDFLQSRFNCGVGTKTKTDSTGIREVTLRLDLKGPKKETMLEVDRLIQQLNQVLESALEESKEPEPGSN
jgi:pimeloyl-ACP methyl ester carboxylesterase